MPIYYATKAQCLFARMFDAEQPRKKHFASDQFFMNRKRISLGRSMQKMGVIG